MNWTRTILAGLAAGVAMNVSSFVMHGLIMAGTYTRYDEVFEQEAASPLYFLITSLVLGQVAAVIFAKSRAGWGPGLVGGAAFGALVGLVPGFTNFFWPLVIAGFPYFLSWCWLGIDVITYGVGGLVLGLLIPLSRQRPPEPAAAP